MTKTVVPITRNPLEPFLMKGPAGEITDTINQRLQALMGEVKSQKGQEMLVEIGNLGRQLYKLANPDPIPGVCRYCGCTEDDPCYYHLDGDDDLVPCAWQDNEETVCSNTRCLDKYFAEKKGLLLRPSRDPFLCGFGLAVGSLARDHNEPTTAGYIMRGAGVTVEKLRAAGVDPFDLKYLPKDKNETATTKTRRRTRRR